MWKELKKINKEKDIKMKYYKYKILFKQRNSN